MITMFRQEYSDLAIFNGLMPAQIRALSPYLDEINFHEGEAIFTQGEPAVFLFILLAGEVTVRYKPYDGPAITVARILPGKVFGWSAALGRDAYTSNAEATRDGMAYRIRVAHLQKLCEREPQAGKLLLERFAESIAEGMRNTNASVLQILSQGMDRKGMCTKKECEE